MYACEDVCVGVYVCACECVSDARVVPISDSGNKKETKVKRLREGGREVGRE